MQSMRTATIWMSLLALAACKSSDEAATEEGNAISKSLARKSFGELKQAKSEMSPEELAEARRKAGFKTKDELYAENAKTFEKAAREYVKTRLKDYRSLVKDLSGELTTLENEAKKWAGSKSADKQFAKFEEKYRERAKALTKRYDELTGHGAEGGETQVILGRAFRTWDDMNNDLGPGIAQQEAFSQTLDSIRKDLEAAEKAFADIENDAALVENKFYDDKSEKSAKADPPEAAEGGG